MSPGYLWTTRLPEHTLALPITLHHPSSHTQELSFHDLQALWNLYLLLDCLFDVRRDLCAASMVSCLTPSIAGTMRGSGGSSREARRQSPAQCLWTCLVDTTSTEIHSVLEGGGGGGGGGERGGAASSWIPARIHRAAAAFHFPQVTELWAHTPRQLHTDRVSDLPTRQLHTGRVSGLPTRHSS